MRDNSAIGACRPGKHNLCIVATALMVSGCQGLDSAKTDAVNIRPAIHSLRSKPVVQPVYAMYTVHSFRSKPQVPMTSTMRTTETVYAFASPQCIKARMPGPAKVSFNPGGDGAFLGSSPYICSPSGFGQLSSCHARYL